MGVSIQYRLEQAKRLLFSLSVFNAYLPVLAFISTTFMFVFVGLWKFGVFPLDEVVLGKVDYIVRHFFDTSLMTLFLMLINAKSYKWLSWLCLCCLFIIWALNAVYVWLDYEAGFYYCIYVSIIYFTFVVITVGKVFIRC